MEVERPANQVTLTKRYTDEAKRFIARQNRSDTPFFLYLAHTFPHVPLFASPEFHGKSRAGRYGDVVEELDWSVGQILQTLRELGMGKDTLVFFTSDNGPWLVMNDEGGSAGPLREGKGSTWEGGMRVPAIAWWPGTIEPGRTAIVANAMDLFTTSLELGGASLPEGVIIDGRDLSPFLMDGKLPPRKAFFFYRGRELFACRLGPWKAHFKTRPSVERLAAETHDPPLLYHLARDPSEKRIRPGDRIGGEAIREIQAALERHRAGLKPKEPQF